MGYPKVTTCVTSDVRQILHADFVCISYQKLGLKCRPIWLWYHSHIRLIVEPNITPIFLRIFTGNHCAWGADFCGTIPIGDINACLYKRVADFFRERTT